MPEPVQTSQNRLIALVIAVLTIASLSVQAQPGPVISGPTVLSGPHCRLLSYNFDVLTPGGCEDPYFTLVSGPGAIDPMSGFWSYQPSAADVGQSLMIEVRAECPSGATGPIVPVALDITNDPPVLTTCPDASLVADAGYARTVDFDADDSCPQTLVYAIIDSSPIDGTVSLNPQSGVLTLVAANSDFGRVDVTVSVTDSFGADTCAVRFFVTPTACQGGITGDINGDERVTISDVLALVNVLFFGMDMPRATVFANVDGDPDCRVDVADVIYLASHLMLGGPPPASCLAACEGSGPFLNEAGDTVDVDLPADLLPNPR
ncbi:hypothetical protein GF420_12770 [candidate division GN15 bacterium]|nr:hypothetical protein [candidate division GN15 bacterium]